MVDQTPLRDARHRVAGIALLTLALLAAANPVQAGDGSARTPAGQPVAPKPPRADGAYFLVGAGYGAIWAQTTELSSPGAIGGSTFELSFGETVLPWLSLGFRLGGAAGRNDTQKMGLGHLLFDAGFYLSPRRPTSIHLAFGFGGGALRDDRREDRLGIGGAQFRLGVRHEFFPFADRRRPTRAGGWTLAPEIGLVGLPGKDEGRASGIGAYATISTGFYFGR